MRKLVIRVLITGATIFGVAYFLPSLISVADFETAVLAAAVLALVNMFIRPIVKILTLPIKFMTLGLIALAINALMLFIVANAIDGFDIMGFWQAIVAALIISAVSTFLSSKLED